MTSEDLLANFFSLRKGAEELHQLIRKAEARGLSPDRERVGWRILKDFVNYGLEDLQKGERQRARTTAQELRKIFSETYARLEDLLAGRLIQQEVPRYSTSRIGIQDGHFQATRTLPNGTREHGPIIFTGYGHFDQVKKDLPNFHDYGVNIIQIEIGPSSTITAEGRIETGRVDELLKVFDLATKSNVAINLLISPHYFPKWALEKYPHLSRCEGGFIKFCIDAPEAREIIGNHIRTVITRVKDKLSLHSICLTNEPIYRTCAGDDSTRRLWSRYLRERFGGKIEDARESLRVEASRFEEFPIPDWQRVKPTPLFYHWCVFNQVRFADWHRWMADLIHKIAPELPVHAKIMPTFLRRKNIADGVDPKLFCQLSQINGNDCWCMYNHDEGTYAQDWIWQNMFYDMLRSFENHPIFNSENHIIKDRESRKIPWHHIRTALWQGAIHGQCATTIWVWERTYDKHSDSAGSIMHRPLCIRAAGETALDLMRFSHEVATMQDVPPTVGILYSIAAIVYEEDYLREMRMAYEALNFTGRRIAFVPRDRLLPKVSAPKILVVPAASHVEKDLVEGIRQFICEGGKLILLGSNCLLRDELDKPLKLGLSAEDVTQIPTGLPPERLRHALLQHITPPRVLPVNSKGDIAWGIEWLETCYRGHWLLDAVNLLKSDEKVTWKDDRGRSLRLRNLFTQQMMDDEVELKSLSPVLAEIETSR